MTARHFFRINSSKTCFWTIPKQLLDISWTVPEHFSWMELVQEMLKCMDPLSGCKNMEGESYLLKPSTLKISAFSNREPASGAQGLDQMRWDQASRGPFGHV